MHVHVKLVTEHIVMAKSCAWCAHFKACMQNVRHDPKFISLWHNYTQLKSKGERC